MNQKEMDALIDISVSVEVAQTIISAALEITNEKFTAYVLTGLTGQLEKIRESVNSIWRETATKNS